MTGSQTGGRSLRTGSCTGPWAWRRVLRGAALGVVLVACTSAPSGPAATVDGVEIPREQLDGWVQAAAQGNPDLDVALLSAHLISAVIQREIVNSVLVDLSLVVGPEAVFEARRHLEELAGGPLELQAIHLTVGQPEDHFTDVVLPFEAGLSTLVGAIGLERAVEALMRASESARVSVDPDIGVWDPIAGTVHPS